MTKIKIGRYWDIEDNEGFDLPEVVPSVCFKTRVRDESIGGDNPYRWEDVTTFDLFAGKRVVLFSLPGAFTPTCSNQHLPSFVKNYDKIKAQGVDTIACMAVNDAFVMDAWGKDRQVGDKIKMLGDGSGTYTNRSDKQAKRS